MDNTSNNSDAVGISLYYDGGEASQGLLDAPHFAQFLRAVHNLINTAYDISELENRVKSKKKPTIQLKIKPTFKRGSVIFDLWCAFEGSIPFGTIAMRELLSSIGLANMGIRDLLSYIGVLRFIARFQGENKNRVKVELGDIGDNNIILTGDNSKVVQRPLNPLTRKFIDNPSMIKHAKKVLEMPNGYSDFGIYQHEQRQPKTPIVNGNDKFPIVDSLNYLPGIQEERKEANIENIQLQVLTIQFEGGKKKWRFRDIGKRIARPFSAVIEDKNFLKKVESREIKFDAGTKITADIKIITTTIYTVTYPSKKMELKTMVDSSEKFIVTKASVGKDERQAEFWNESS